MKRLRVLMTADTLGGVFTYALRLSRALGERGIEVVLVTMGAPISAEQRADLERIPLLDMIETDYALEWMPEPWEGVDPAGARLQALARRHEVDLVHVNGFAHAALDYGVPVICAVHSCVCSWWRAVHGCDAPAEWNEYRARVSAGLRSADAIVAPTRAALDAVLACYEVAGAGDRGRVIANGRDAAPRDAGEREPFVLTVGRAWDLAKNLSALDACADTLPWPVLVAGAIEGPSAQRVPLRAMRALGTLASRDVEAWLARASVFCAPARYEPFGLSILEAALAGCALVLGDIASLREVWADAAVYVAPDDIGALRAALNELMSNGELRASMAERARARAQRFGEAAMGDAYAALYADVSSRRSAPALRRAS